MLLLKLLRRLLWPLDSIGKAIGWLALRLPLRESQIGEKAYNDYRYKEANRRAEERWAKIQKARLSAAAERAQYIHSPIVELGFDAPPLRMAQPRSESSLVRQNPFTSNVTIHSIWDHYYHDRNF